MTEIEAIRARHAVRNYTAKPLSPEIIDELSQEIEQCNRLRGKSAKKTGISD